MSDSVVAPGKGGTARTAPLRVRVREREPLHLGRRFREFSSRIGVRPAGWAMLAAVVASALVGWGLGWWEARLAALAGLVVAVCAAIFMIGRPEFDVHLQLPGRRVSVGDDARAVLWVRNAAQRRSRGGSRIELPVGPERAAVHVPALDVAGVHSEQFRLPTDRRAVVPVGPARSVQGDPFGLTGRERDWTDVVEVFVHPRTVALPGRHSGFVHDLEGHATEHLTNSDMSFHALREYVPGDDRRHIHWRSTARTGKLMVRQYEQTRQSRMAIGLDTATQSYASDDEFELAVSVAASLALQAVREGNPLAVLAGGHRLPSGVGAKLLDELCRVQLTPRALLTDTVAAITGQEANASIIALVTGGEQTLLDVRRECAQFGVDARVIGVRVALGEPASVRASANVAILQVGDLADLARLVRQVV